MDRVRRLFSNLQCCKSGTEGDSLKSRNDKYLIDAADCTEEEDFELKAPGSSPRAGGGGGGASGAFVDSKQICLLRSKSCPEILEHNYDGEGSPVQSGGDGKLRQPPSSPLPQHRLGSGGGGGKRPNSGGVQQQRQWMPAGHDHPASREAAQEKSQQQQQYNHHQHNQQRRQRRQKQRSQHQQHQHQHQCQYQRRSADERQRIRAPGDGGGGGGRAFGGGGGGRVDFLHASGDYCVHLPDRNVCSAPGGVGRS